MWFMHDVGDWWLLVFVWMVIFWGAPIALVVWATNRPSKHKGSITKSPPLNIAKGRYARRNIGKEELEQSKEDLNTIVSNR